MRKTDISRSTGAAFRLAKVALGRVFKRRAHKTDTDHLRSRLSDVASFRLAVHHLCLALLALGLSADCHADTVSSIDTFFAEHCLDCHGSGSREGGFDLETLRFDATDRQMFETWVRVHDRVAAGEMPPSDHEELSAEAKRAFVDLISAPLRAADSERQITSGRGVVRRLNRVEYETALSDLLGVPLRVQKQLPMDAKQDGFDTVGAALNVSSVQIEAYLEALDGVLDQATALYEQPPRESWKLDYRDTNGMMQEYRRTGPFAIMPDGVAFFAPEKHAHLNAVLDHFTIPFSAKYRVRVSAYAIRNDEPITLTIRTGGPGHSESDLVPKTLLGHVTVVDGEPQVFEFEQRLERGQFFRIYPASLPYMRFTPQQELRQNDFQGPAVVVQSVEVDGPILDQWPPQSHERLWSGVPMVKLADAEPNEDVNEALRHPPTQIARPKLTRVKLKDRTKAGPVEQWQYVPEQGVGGEPIYRRNRIPDPLHATLKFAPVDAKAEAVRLLSEFVPVAFRRPVEPREVQPFVKLAHAWLDDGDDFETAMRAAYKAVLTSPGFLYVGKTASQSLTDANRGNAKPRLNEHELAERLSLFLWNSLPDETLTRLAATGKLDSPEVLGEQVQRMLDDPKSARFIEDFTAQWLDLRLLDFTAPDESLYPEHDPVLQWSLAKETHAFFRELIDHDLSVNNVVDSDFAMLNSRLAEHYGIAGVDDMAMRKVTLPEDSVRGGVLTQASVLKVTANGTTTSPVIRGVWVLDRIIGKPANPPPPGIPAIEPDIRGAVTVRQQLAAHRNVESCAVCHIQIDPPGVALESFDVIGGFRETYRALNPEMAGKKFPFKPNATYPILYSEGLPVDASDTLPDGASFKDIRQFKALLLREPDQIARTVASKLMTYATGAPISFADRFEIEQVIEQTRATDHGLRSIIHAVVQSRLFRAK